MEKQLPYQRIDNFESSLVKGGQRAKTFLGSRLLTQCLLVIYLLVLTWIILFKMQLSLDIVGTMRSVNLVPFAGATVINGAINYQEAILNAIAFVPFGVYAGMLVRTGPWWKALVPILATSLAFEMLQYGFSMGATDITDLVANTLGGAVGIGLCVIARHVCNSPAHVLRVVNVVALGATLFMLTLFSILVVVNR